MASISASSSSVSFQAPAATFAAICSGLVAPAITLATGGRASSQLKASSSSVWPRASAKSPSFSAIAQFCVGQILVRQALRLGQPRIRRHRRVAPVLAGQQSAGQREIRQQPQAMRAHRRHQLVLVPADQQRYSSWQETKPDSPWLRAVQTASTTCQAGRLRAADVADLARADQVVERAQRLLDRRQRIGLVHLVEVDPVGAQPLQARLHRRHDVAARCRPAARRRRPSACRTWSPARCPCGARPGSRPARSPTRRARHRRRRCRTG